LSEDGYKNIIHKLKDEGMITHAAINQFIAQKYSKNRGCRKIAQKTKLFDKNYNFRSQSTVKSSPIYRRPSITPVRLRRSSNMKWEIPFEENNYDVYNNLSLSDDEDDYTFGKGRKEVNNYNNAHIFE